MTHGDDVRFVVSGGSQVGLGHVMRCASLAAEAARRGLRSSFVLRGDGSARDALQREHSELEVSSWRTVEDVGDDTRWLVFDTRDSIESELAYARQSGIRTAVLDRSDVADLADLTVLPVLHAAPHSHPRILQGADFCIIPPHLRRDPVPTYPGERTLFLLTLGGADPQGLTQRLSDWLEGALQGQTWERHVVLGPAFRDASAAAGALGSRGWQVHFALPRESMAGLMRQARAAVAGFGTSVYELAFLGVPTLYATHQPTDLTAARALEAHGIGCLAGDAGGLSQAEFTESLKRSLLDADWCLEASAAGRRLLAESDGARRVLDELFGGGGA